MVLDDTIQNHVALYAYFGIFALTWHFIVLKRNPRPPRSRYRRDGKTPWVAFWNLFDESVFTPEAIKYHRGIVKSMPLFVMSFLVTYFLVAQIW